MEITLIFTPIEIIVMVISAPITAGAYYLIKQYMNRSIIIRSHKKNGSGKKRGD